jgi:hypothetical protein
MGRILQAHGDCDFSTLLENNLPAHLFYNCGFHHFAHTLPAGITKICKISESVENPAAQILWNCSFVEQAPRRCFVILYFRF